MNAMPPPSILILTTFFDPLVGGVETHARELASYFRSRDCDVIVVTKRVDGLPRFARVHDVPVHRVGPNGRRSALAKWQLLPFAAVALWRLRRRYSVIYCPDPRGVGLAAVLVARWLGRRVVFEAATPGTISCANWQPALGRWGIRPEGTLARALTWLPRRVYAAADHLVCLSGEIEDECRTAGVPPARLTRLAHGIDLAHFRPPAPDEARTIRTRLGLPLDRRLCLFVGRLSREKGVLDILEAWRSLEPEGAVLVLAGPDTPGHPLDAGRDARRFVADHGLADQVRLVGPVPDPAEWLRAADLFVHPSHYEAFGLSVLEALASGLPVVATAVPGLTQYLVDDENALLCPPGAPLDLARQLDRLLRDAGLRHRLGAGGRATVERRFDREQVFGVLLDLMRPETV